MPTLSLSIIVGPGDAKELERCLKSVQGPLFDEIVVTRTAPDPDVERVAKTYASKSPFFPWCDDFAAARNFCLSHCTMDRWFWLDADDVILPEDYSKLLKLKPELDRHEVIYLRYVYSHQEDGSPDTVLPRERILPNNGAFKWQWPIHEAIYPTGNVTHLENEISIHHYQKPGHGGMERNIRILEKEWNKPVKQSRMCFYYARDLLGAGGLDRGEKVAVECIEKNYVFGDEKGALCRSLASGYYGRSMDTKRPPGEREAMRDLAVKYSWIGIEADHRFAELWSYLGCVAYDRKDEDSAILYFETALGCLREVNIGSVSSFYAYVPAKNLYMIYYYRGDYAKALVYNKLLLELNPKDQTARQNRDLTWKQYFNKYPKSIAQHGYELKSISVVENPPTEAQRYRPVSVAWLIPWVNMDDPATRIRRVNVSHKLEQMGIDSTVIHDYHRQDVGVTLKEIRDAQICVFTQYTDKDLELMAAVKKAGKKVVIDSCEALFGIPGQRDAWSMADRVVCCSTKLAEMHKEKGMDRVSVVPDAAEVGF